MDLKTLKYLISCDIFCLNYENDKLKVVNNKEIRMSRLILDKGWNIGVY